MNNQQGPNFFTEGVGNNTPDQNPLGAVENLNTNTWSQKEVANETPATSKESPQKPERPEVATNTSEQPPVSLTPDILVPEATPTAPELKLIRTEGDRLANGSLAAAKKSETRLTATDDANGFYKEIRGKGGAMQSNLENSFGRELGKVA